jgi:hypothetical protein
VSRDAAEGPRWRLLLAGSVGPERVPARPDTPAPRWFEPLHVRDEGGALDRLASQVAAGADVIVAPTWLTHRRALVPVGETRQARAWTAAAVRVAREAVEVGMERREEAQKARAADDDRVEADAAPRPRPAPLVAASLPSLDEVPESESGRLLPRVAASERDYRDQAGLLADAQPDLLLVEGQGTLAEMRTAASEAAATGLVTWLALSGLEGPPVGDSAREEAALDLAREAGVARSLLPPPPRRPAALQDHAWGGLVGRADLDAGSGGEDPAAAWLVAGAGALGLIDGATPGRLQRLRNAVDEHERAEVAGWRNTEGRWWAHVQLAASMAPGGAALWLVAGPDDDLADGVAPEPTGAAGRTALPGGFAWVVVGRGGSNELPADHFRLVIDPVGGSGAPSRWGALLERGGILALPLDRASELGSLTALLVDDSQPPPLAILRREA